MEFLSEINSVLWGKWMTVLLLLSGVYLSIKTSFIQVGKFLYVMKNTVFRIFEKKEKSSDGVTPFQAVSTALGGTIGTGSIAGIITAITLGGAGTVFWMWVSAFFGMATKYSEIVLAQCYRQKTDSGKFIGGPMFYIEKGMGKRWLAVLFSVFAVFASFGIGNMVQANAISDVFVRVAGVSPWITGSVLCAVSGFVILGGLGLIAKVNEKIVPVMAVFYVSFTIIILFMNCNKIPDAISLIFKEAISLRAIGGGALQYGFSRGIFSNEAGLGSAPMAHGSADATSPCDQGLWGIFEVFFTTIVICTLTALCVITSNLGGMDMFAGNIGKIGVGASTVLFAFSSILGWGYYGEVCIGYLLKKSVRAMECYRILFVLFVFVGAVSRLEAVWTVSEIMNAFMAVPNIIAVVYLGRKVKEVTKKHFKK